MLGTPDALPAGTRVAEFELKSMLGSGGFGIVYLAWDHALEREVALKEYMPGTLAGRGSGLHVSVRTGSGADTYQLGLRSFINEARLLARFDHPSLVKVYRFWEDNGTAYMVMPYYRGRTLRQARAGMIVPPAEGACRRVLDALLAALDVLHREGVYHRDIAPDNILLGDDGVPVLLDFGAARRVIGDGAQALTSIMKPHFAPLEQYADATALRQGPWTDLYALGGTIYFLITGQSPVPAASRALHDDQPRLATLRPADCSPGFLAAIDWMLALRPPERPQSVQMLRDVLDGRMAAPARLREDITVPGVATRVPSVVPAAPRTDFDPTELHSSTVAVPAGARAAVVTAPPHAPSAPSAPPPATPAPPPTPHAPHASAPVAARVSRHSLMLLLLALLLGNGAAWWWVAARPSREPAVTVPVLAEQAPAAAPIGVPAQVRSADPLPAAALRSEPSASETVLSVMPAQPRAETRTAATSAPTSASAPAPRPRATELRSAALEAAAMTSPRARCANRVLLANLMCVKRECEQAAMRSHSECVRMREQEEEGRNRSSQ